MNHVVSARRDGSGRIVHAEYPSLEEAQAYIDSRWPGHHYACDGGRWQGEPDDARAVAEDTLAWIERDGVRVPRDELAATGVWRDLA